jgi:hypothetical protein
MKGLDIVCPFTYASFNRYSVVKVVKRFGGRVVRKYDKDGIKGRS